MNEKIKDQYWYYINTDDYSALPATERVDACTDALYDYIRENITNNLSIEASDFINSRLCDAEEIGFVLGFKFATQLLTACGCAPIKVGDVA